MLVPYFPFSRPFIVHVRRVLGQSPGGTETCTEVLMLVLCPVYCALPYRVLLKQVSVTRCFGNGVMFATETNAILKSGCEHILICHCNLLLPLRGLYGFVRCHGQFRERRRKGHFPCRGIQWGAQHGCLYRNILTPRFQAIIAPHEG